MHPPLRIRQSNRLEVLADALCADLAAPAAGAPLLAPEVVLVQSPGMAQWLRYRLAEHLGVAANLDCPLPAVFLWRVLRLLDPALPETSAFDRAPLAWRLLRLLPGLLDEPAYAPLADYVADDADGLHLWQLCHKVADLFDEYQVYRPDWLAAWEGRPVAGADPVDAQAAAAAEPWQPALWQVLVADTAEPHRGALLLDALQRLTDGRVPDGFAAGLPPRLHLFGVASLPPLYLQLLLRLAAWLPVTVDAFNPCRAYWADIVSPRFLARQDELASAAGGSPGEHLYDTGHPLLAANGLLGRDFVDLLLQFTEQLAELEDAFVEPAADLHDPQQPLLQRLQADVLDLTTRGCSGRLDGAALADLDSRLPVAADDRSLRFAVCHGPMREVEALHDHLLACFAADPQLTPRDVVVMVPDVAAYAPCIDAVFGGASGARRVPWSISDRGFGQEHPVLAAVAALLALPDGRLALGDVEALLAVPAVQRRLGLAAADVDQLVHWLRAAGVRWGRDLAHWQALGFAPGDAAAAGEPAGGANTWAFGLQRLLLGYATGGSAAPFADVLSHPGVVGQAARLVGVLADLLERLDSHLAALRTPASAPVWRQRLVALLDDLLAPDDADAQVLELVHRALGELDDQAAAAGFSGELSLPVLQALLDAAVAGDAGGHRFLSGRVTVCTLMPMRTIPFKVVCLLGMNNGAYPRRDVPLGFNRISRQRRKGDRSRRLEDRFLFLEAVLAARDQVYLSWTGRSARDNSELVPSVLVGELRDLLAAHCRPAAAGGAGEAGDPGEAVLAMLTREHRLQPFNPDNYRGDDGSFDPLWQPGPAAAPPPPAAPDARAQPAPEALALTELVDLLRNPPGWWFGSVLDAPQPRPGDLPADHEPFRLDGLAQWHLHDELLDEMARGGTPAAVLERARLAGRLPRGVAGAVAAQALGDFLQGPGAALLVARQVPAQVHDLRLTVAGTRLSGRLSGITAHGLVEVLTGRAAERHLAAFWLRLCALRAAGVVADGWLLHAKGAVICRPRTDDPAPGAQAVLEAALRLWQAARGAPPPLPPAGMHAWVGARADGADATAANRAAARVWPGSHRDDYRADARDPAVLRLLGDNPWAEPAALQPWLHLAGAVLEPLYREADQRTWAQARALLPWTEAGA